MFWKCTRYISVIHIYIYLSIEVISIYQPCILLHTVFNIRTSIKIPLICTLTMYVLPPSIQSIYPSFVYLLSIQVSIELYVYYMYVLLYKSIHLYLFLCLANAQCRLQIDIDRQIIHTCILYQCTVYIQYQVSFYMDQNLSNIFLTSIPQRLRSIYICNTQNYCIEYQPFELFCITFRSCHKGQLFNRCYKKSCISKNVFSLVKNKIKK